MADERKSIEVRHEPAGEHAKPAPPFEEKQIQNATAVEQTSSLEKAGDVEDLQTEKSPRRLWWERFSRRYLHHIIYAVVWLLFTG